MQKNNKNKKPLSGKEFLGDVLVLRGKQFSLYYIKFYIQKWKLFWGHLSLGPQEFLILDGTQKSLIFDVKTKIGDTIIKLTGTFNKPKSL